MMRDETQLVEELWTEMYKICVISYLEHGDNYRDQI